MNPIDPELLSLTNELAKLGGSRKVKLSPISVFIRGINSNISSPVNNVNYISFIEENNQIIIRHPSSANDMRCYDISKYFPPTISNERVSADIVNKITTSVFDGFNINLISYGSTNTGKSQLLFGSSSDNMQYDSCEGLFGTLSANILRKIDQSNDKISLSISFWEIGQNKIIDLLENNKNNRIESPFQISAVTISNWEQIVSVWDIARYNSLNWKTLNSGYQIISNESNLFIQIKIYNETQQRVTTLNIIDLVGIQYMIRSIRSHITRDQIEQNKSKNINLFSLNKLLHHLCNLHLQNQDNNNDHKDIIQNVISESLLNNFIGPMLTQNAETIFIGTVSCNSNHYQASLRTIQILSRTLSIKVPCIHTPFNNHQTNQLPILSFQQFLKQWQSILYKHIIVEDSIKKQMKQYENMNSNNITKAIDDFNLSTDSIDDQLQELKKNIPQNILHSNSKTKAKFVNDENQNNNNKLKMKEEFSSLLDDILEPKMEQISQNSSIEHLTNDFTNAPTHHESYLASDDLQEMLKSTKYPTNSKNENIIKTQEDEANKTVVHLEFTNLRLENCKLKEEIRKLKSESKYSSIFDDYDREIKTLNKLLQNMSNDNKLLSLKTMQLKQDIAKYRLSSRNNINAKSDELKTVRILQKTLRETTKKLKEKEKELLALSSSQRHTDIRNRVLSTSKEEWYELSQALNDRESELSKSYLAQAETQANVDRLQLIVSELQHENNTLKVENKSLENEVATLRHLCKKINEDIKQRNQLNRVSKKWASLPSHR